MVQYVCDAAGFIMRNSCAILLIIVIIFVAIHNIIVVYNFSGFELTFQKWIVKIFCRTIGGNGATTPHLGHLHKIGVTCAQTTCVTYARIHVTYAKNMHTTWF